MPPLLRWVPSARFPGFVARTRHSDSCPPIPPCSLGSLGGTAHAEATRPPRFLDDPLLTCPALRPRWAVALDRCHATVLPSDGLTTSAPQSESFEAPSHGPHARCLRFAAHGHPRATQDSLPVGRPPLTGRDSHPLDRSEEFQNQLILPPFPGFAWRTKPHSLRVPGEAKPACAWHAQSPAPVPPGPRKVSSVLRPSACGPLNVCCLASARGILLLLN